jgi:hypothetical protein
MMMTLRPTASDTDVEVTVRAVAVVDELVVVVVLVPGVGFDRIAALYYPSSTSHQIYQEIRYLYF